MEYVSPKGSYTEELDTEKEQWTYQTLEGHDPPWHVMAIIFQEVFVSVSVI
jgi:hypothetical protein